MDDPDLLYEDLFEDLEDGRAIIKTSIHEMEDRLKDLSNEAEQLRLQVRNLREQNEGLSKQNEILTRNISCLFKTAQMEISRKDKQIRSLQQESLNASASCCRSLLPTAPSANSEAAGKGQRADTVSLVFGNGGRRHDESAGVAPRNDRRSQESEALPARKQDHRTVDANRHSDHAEMMMKGSKAGRAGARCQDRAEVLKESNGMRGNPEEDEVRKRRRGSDEKSREDYGRRRENERYRAGARRGGGEGGHRSSSSLAHAHRRPLEGTRDKRLCC